MARLRIAAVVLAIAWPSVAIAQAPHTVHLVAPSCGDLPFSPSRLRELLSLELEIDGVVLVEDPALAEAEVAYEPDPCNPGTTRFVFHLVRGDARYLHDADVGAVPLATVPRALALQLAEALRSVEGTSEPAHLEEEPPPPLRAPEPPPQAEVAIEPAPRTGPPTRIGVAATARNAPDAGGTLAGAFAFVDLPLGDELPLLVRVDGGASFGPSAYDLVFGSITGGVALSVWARALDSLAVRFGPRLWLGYGWAFDAANARRQSLALQVGVGVVAAGELALTDRLALLVEAEVGTNLIGIDYAVDAGRSGFVGAYWGGQLALAWRV